MTLEDKLKPNTTVTVLLQNFHSCIKNQHEILRKQWKIKAKGTCKINLKTRNYK